MRLRIIKCHGSGNDFPLIDARRLALDDATWAGVARALADRRGPVGGDGMLLLTEGDGQYAFGFRMFNSDGSESETCLNGLRCVARAGFAALGIEAARVRLKTSEADVARDDDLADGVYTVRETAGPVSLDVAAWPMRGLGERVIETPIAATGSARAFTAIAIPNPHLVAFVEAVDEAELVAVGGVCEAAPDWLPNRANVSFVATPQSETLRGPREASREPDALFVRTYERGVGLTDSCGSAMAASTHAAGLTGRIAFGTPVTVFNRGGMVRAVAGEDGMVTLSGNATFEWEGAVTVDPATGVAGDLVIERWHNDEIDSWARVADAAR
ncbi:Diaminopimelate epimerase [Sphingomonas sp. EC-HK361]|jgi:diaminopimelate epimerase|uniref:diaminopimelate epimerase n=1 Tax=Sphingomonas sp. EC-HK361 TaxID=2038397 RepID=UPI001254B95A|nr:diaminopimelate epimerase [Sphingomonas sp. EC-HK361]VVT00271.1 Diaminopimelate epimerase [Sphingomonas sp. EC-HK361]